MLYSNYEDFIDAIGYDRVYKELEEVRLSGKCNMFDFKCVYAILPENSKIKFCLTGIYGQQIYSECLANWPKDHD
jgi:hypothetical protein